MTTAPAAHRAATPDRVRAARHTPWPYAGVVSGLASGTTVFFPSQGQELFARATTTPSTQLVVDTLTPELAVRTGAGLGLVGLVSSLVFLLGLTRFVARHAPQRERLVEALRWTSITFVATGAIGVVIRYIAAGGVPESLDHMMYTAEATATIAVLADQLATAAFLPGLGVMALVGVAAVRDRVLARTVGVVALVLTGASTLATLAIGLPYSSSLVWPVFALVAGVAGLASRRAA